MANFYADNEDLKFYIEKWLKWDELLEINEREGFGEGKEFKNHQEAIDVYKDMLEMMGEFAAEEVAPVAAAIDKQELQLVDGDVILPPEMQAIFDKIKGLDLHGMCLPREFGGMNLPVTLYMLNLEMMARGDVATTMHHGFHGGMAMAMFAFSVDEGTTEVDLETRQIKSTRFEKEAKEIMTGEAWGCMDITEPDAGSDMAALRTKAVQDDEGNWSITGQKIFITSGNGKYHFVIARTEDPKPGDDAFAGLKGLSFFLVETYSEDDEGNRTWHAVVERIEEKLGIHGSATCTIGFDKTPAQLIGTRGDGFRHMLLLMNGARVGVASMSLGLCEAAYRMAKDYAAERRSMGKTIDQHEMIADTLDEMQTDIQGIRALTMFGSYNEELATKTEIMLKFLEPGTMEYMRMEKKLKESKQKSRFATPLIKYIGSEKSVEMARRCVQIHGGSGYTREYGAEKLLRDSVILPIYEGTSQIQALMAMKDALGGIIKNPQAFVKGLAQARWLSISSRDPLERRVARLRTTCLSAQQHLMHKIAAKKLKSLSDKPINTWPKAFLKDWDPKRDFAPGMLHAERLIKLLTDMAICDELFEQGKVYPERREILIRYIEKAEPRSRFLLDEITTTGERLLAELSGDAEVQKIAQ